MNGVKFNDLLDIRYKAHVKHAVRFVHDQDLDPGEHQLATFEMVEQAAGCRDQDINAAVELLVLVFEGDAADQQGHREFVVLAVALETFGHLGGKFARRLEDQRPRHARIGAPAGQQLDHWKREGRGFPRPGLRNTDDISALQYLGNSPRLDRRRGGVAGIPNGVQQLRAKAQAGETDFVGG